MKHIFVGLLALLMFGLAGSLSAAAICVTTPNTNSDCGYILTIGAGGVFTGVPVAGANPYDGSDDAEIGVVNNSGAAFTGSVVLSGSGNGGGLFAFESDGICSYLSPTPAFCSVPGATGYEGPLVTFSGINAAQTSGTINIKGLAAGATTYFSLESSPASINAGGGPMIGNAPEPGTMSLLGASLAGLFFVYRRRKA